MAAVENKLEIEVPAVDEEDQMDATEDTVTGAGDAVTTAKKQKKKKKSKKLSKCAVR